MNELAKIAAKQIAEYRNNPVIMGFVESSALEQVASDIRAKTGSGTTAKAVELLQHKDKSIKERLNHYINAGLLGVYMESIAA